MRSMTGFGRGSSMLDGREAVVELKSVNHRFLDLGFRMPRSLGHVEATIRERMQVLERGHVDLYLNYRNTRQDARKVELDEGLAAAYMAALERLGDLTGADDDTVVSHLAALPEVLVIRDNDEDELAVQQVVLAALDEALGKLQLAEQTEGERLEADLTERLHTMERLLTGIEEASGNVTKELQAKLHERLQTLLGDAGHDPTRLLQEVALLADRAAIDEETVRLRSHITAAREAMAEGGPCGRKLDFIVQEMHREVNTIGSKTVQLEVTSAVLSLKGEIEKIREQVQNIV